MNKQHQKSWAAAKCGVAGALAVELVGEQTAVDLWSTIYHNAVPKLDATIALAMVADSTDWIRARQSPVGAAMLVEIAAKAFAGAQGVAGPALRATMCNAIEAWRELAMQAENLETGFGWDLSMAWECVNQRDAYGIPIDHSQLQAIATLACAMAPHLEAGAKRSRVESVPEEMTDVQIGGKVERLIASELAQLSSAGPLGSLAKIRLIGSKASEYRVEGSAPAGRGPLVIAVDESGSMADKVAVRDLGVQYSRHDWAKACMAGLVKIAHAHGRVAVVVHFSTETVVTRIEPGDARALQCAIEHNYNGSGTRIASAIRRGEIEISELRQEGFSGADLVLLTDGEDPDSLLAGAISDMNADLYLVSIGVRPDAGHPLSKGAKHATFINKSCDLKVLAELGASAGHSPADAPN